MFTIIIIASLQFIDKILFSWWIDPVLDFLQTLTVNIGLADTFILPILSSSRVVLYFVPAAHLLAFVSVIVASTGLKTFCSLYHFVIKLKPT